MPTTVHSEFRSGWVRLVKILEGSYFLLFMLNKVQNNIILLSFNFKPIPLCKHNSFLLNYLIIFLCSIIFLMLCFKIKIPGPCLCVKLSNNLMSCVSVSWAPRLPIFVRNWLKLFSKSVCLEENSEVAGSTLLKLLFVNFPPSQLTT